MKYKSHIDGLRAFAVVPIVIFHLDSPFFPGGYIGVDIFFVISGFLITSVLYEDFIQNRYSLLEFYKRRILRILPALTVMLLATAFLSMWILLPAEQVEAGNSIAAAALFISNFYFLSDSGYFSGSSESKPLLHMWSLAVEEQFYIFFPPLIYFLLRYFKKYIIAVLVILIILSFSACIWLTFRHQPTAFYLLPPRAWELGIGAALAIWLHRHGERNGNTIVALLGFALIIGPLFLLNKESLFPGWNAAFPCVGAMLLIGWGEGTVIGRLLSLPPVVWVGKISYSFYLWHWPVIVFWKIYHGQTLSSMEMIALGFVSIFLGAGSTFLIEKPFRTRKARAIPTQKVILSGSTVLVGLAALGVLISLNMVQLRSYPDRVVAFADVANYREWPDYEAQFRTGQCLIGQDDGAFSAYDTVLCARFDSDRPNILLIGDSHAAMYWGALQDMLKDVNVLQVTSSGCRPLLDGDGTAMCKDMRDWAFKTLLPSGEIDGIVIGGRWIDSELPLLRPTLERLATYNVPIILIGPTVEYNGSFPNLLAHATWRGKPFDFDALLTPGRKLLNRRMAEVAKQAGIVYMDVLKTLCGSKDCTLTASDGVPMQFDYGHLTLSGARDVLSDNQDIYKKALGPMTPSLVNRW